MESNIKQLCDEYEQNKNSFKTELTVEEVLEVLDLARENLEKKGLIGSYYCDAVILALKAGFILGRNEVMKKAIPDNNSRDR